MMTQPGLLTLALLTAAIGLVPIGSAQAANWVELGESESTGETIKLHLDSVKPQRGSMDFEFVYQIGPDEITASVHCPKSIVYPQGYPSFVPNKGSTTARMVRQVCEIGRRLTRDRQKTTQKPQVLPLQVGTYSVGSKYIQIAKQGDRYCYQGSSSRGMTIASLVPRRNGMYAIHTWDDGFVKQQDADHLLFGSATNMLAYPMDQEAPSQLSEPMQECLNSTEPFYQQYEGMRNPVRVK